MVMTPEQREAEIERLKKIGEKGRRAQKRKLGKEAHSKFMSEIGKKGALSKWGKKQ